MKFGVNTFIWASRQHMPSNMTVTTRMDGNTAHVVVESFDAKGNYESFEKLKGNVASPAARNSYEICDPEDAPGALAARARHLP